MIRNLNIVDNIEMPYVTNNDDIDYRGERNHSLRSNIFYLVSFKHVIDTKKQEDIL